MQLLTDNAQLTDNAKSYEYFKYHGLKKKYILINAICCLTAGTDTVK